MMELFTLGAGRGYTETDVRQNARALTGFRNDWKRERRPHATSATTRSTTTPGTKTIFKKRGTYTWKDSCRLCVTHPDHPSFFVQKLWSYFVPTAPDAATAERAPAAVRARASTRSGRSVEAILRHPGAVRGAADGEVARALHRGAPAPARPPDRHHRLDVARRDGGPAALLSAERRRLGRHALARHGDGGAAAGGSRSTRSTRTRSIPARRSSPYDAQKLVHDAIGFWREPPIGAGTLTALQTFAKNAVADAKGQKWKQQQYPPMVQNALRHLIAVSPEFQAA